MGEEARVGRGPGSSWVFFVSFLTPERKPLLLLSIVPRGWF